MTPQTIIVDSDEKRKRATDAITRLPLPFDVTIGPHIDRRSNDQNARLWKLHSEAAKVVGCTAEDMHEDMLCEHYGYNELTMPSGAIRRVPLKRSRVSNKKDFHDFMESVEAFYATELGVFLA